MNKNARLLRYVGVIVALSSTVQFFRVMVCDPHTTVLDDACRFGSVALIGLCLLWAGNRMDDSPRQAKPMTRLRLSVMIVTCVSFGIMVGTCVMYRLCYEQLRVTNDATSLSRASLDVTRSTVMLKTLREQKTDRVIRNLETDLDFALVDIGRYYSPERDWFNDTEETVALARDYRARYPHTNSLQDINGQVTAVLSRDFSR